MTTPGLSSQTTELHCVSVFYIPVDIAMHKVLFWEADETLWRTYLNVLFISSEPGGCKTLVKDQAQTFVPGPLTY